MRDSSLGPLLAVFYGCGFLAGFNENLVNMALVAIMGDSPSMPWRRSGL